MCDYSLQTVKSRPAAVGDRLRVHNFGTGSCGFADIRDPACSAFTATAVCVLPGTELVFDAPISFQSNDVHVHKEAIFRQINKEQPNSHHDCLELPDGEQMLLTYLYEGQTATVLQLPAAPRNEAEVQEQTRVPVAA